MLADNVPRQRRVRISWRNFQYEERNRQRCKTRFVERVLVVVPELLPGGDGREINHMMADAGTRQDTALDLFWRGLICYFSEGDDRLQGSEKLWGARGPCNIWHCPGRDAVVAGELGRHIDLREDAARTDNGS